MSAPAEGERCGQATTPGAAARLGLSLALREGRVYRARFVARGCPATLAVADWVCEWVAERTPDEALDLNVDAVEQALALPASKRHCVLLVQDALAEALQSPVETHARTPGGNLRAGPQSYSI